ncbi:phage tail tape measure protein [Limnohabitans sp.]|uniref:phage tail tape measure protein n=1 Tax=Limnohabitans sp. TaxID=1907725 RepID=UPI00286F2090|nr:phage tail tape measure protein [Limnohabitans sp.]
MRELKLKYFIDLVSTIGQRSTAEAKTLEKAHEQMNKAVAGTSARFNELGKWAGKAGKDVGQMQGEITGTTSKFVALDRAITQMGGNTGSTRQVGYIQQLGNQIDRARNSAMKLRDALSKPLGGVGADGKDGKGAPNSLMGDAQRLAGIVGATRLARTAFDDNMEFEKLQLKMKFNAQLSNEDVAALRQDAIDLSKSSLNKPLDVSKAQFRLANAGLKMDSIRKLTPAVVNSAQVFDAAPDEIADLVFDMVTKSGIKEERVPAMLDMLYSHATSGRFETMDMARQAPDFLNSAKTVGITGERGLNFMGALTQRMMRNATVRNPSEVSTIIKEGLAHITTPHMTGLAGKKHSQGATGLMKFGIKVTDYFDKDGNFKGEGGVDGIVGLAREMKSKHLDNPFMMGMAGIREHYTQLFWREMMNSIDAPDTDKDPNLVKMMERGQLAQKSGQLAKNLEDVKQSGYGKMLDVGVNTQNAMVGTTGEALTSGAANAASWASNHPKTMIAAGVLGAGATIFTGGLAAPWVLAALGAAGGTAALGAGGDWLSNRWATPAQPSPLNAVPGARPPFAVSGMGMPPAMDFLSLSAPGMGTQPFGGQLGGQSAQVQIGQGQLDINVRVTDDRVTLSPTVAQQPSLIRINPGSTNPAGYSK